jgi:hypothetical protein
LLRPRPAEPRAGAGAGESGWGKGGRGGEGCGSDGPGHASAGPGADIRLRPRGGRGCVCRFRAATAGRRLLIVHVSWRGFRREGCELVVRTRRARRRESVRRSLCPSSAAAWGGGPASAAPLRRRAAWNAGFFFGLPPRSRRCVSAPWGLGVGQGTLCKCPSLRRGLPGNRGSYAAGRGRSPPALAFLECRLCSGVSVAAFQSRELSPKSRGGGGLGFRGSCGFCGALVTPCRLGALVLVVVVRLLSLLPEMLLGKSQFQTLRFMRIICPLRPIRG